jgi:hypothetical protein
MVEIEDIDLINHNQKIGVNFQSSIGKKLNGFFHSILTHPVWGWSLGFGRIVVDGWTGVVGRTGKWDWFFTRLRDT